MAIMLALTAAVSWGASDFLGGLAGRRAGSDIAVATSFIGQLIGAAGIGLAIAVLPAGQPTATDLWVGAAAGLCGAVGLLLLYRGLTIGKMGVIAPVTGAGAASLPIVYGVLLGELPSALAWAGVATALIAIVLVSREPATDVAFRGWATPGLREALGAGVGFGLIFVLLDLTSEGSGLWPLLPMKLSASALLVALGVGLGRRLTPPRHVWWTVAGVGLLDNLANITFLYATRSGLVALVSVLSSLYPVGTILLARWVLHERLVRSQVGGLLLAGIGVTLIAVG